MLGVCARLLAEATLDEAFQIHVDSVLFQGLARHLNLLMKVGKLFSSHVGEKSTFMTLHRLLPKVTRVEKEVACVGGLSLGEALIATVVHQVETVLVPLAVIVQLGQEAFLYLLHFSNVLLIR